MNGSKHRTTDGLNESRKDSSGYSSTKREWNLQTHALHDDSSNHRKYVRTRSSSNTRTTPSSSQQPRQNGDKEKKKPIRVSGDWSEFRSSTGKTYFYNSKTEVSQWEKPKGWSVDETSIDQPKKEATNSNHASTSRPQPSIENTSTVKHHPNGDRSSHKLHETLQSSELPIPDDESSRMSFSSTGSKKSAAVPIHDRSSDVNDSVVHSTPIIYPEGLHRNEVKSSTTAKIPHASTTEQTAEVEVSTLGISKAERDQEIQKYYRADLIEHLTNWPSTQLEKQCLKRFDDYYGYSAKMSTTLIDLKALKSNFRILEIKRSGLTQRLLRCQQREDDQ